MSRNFGIAKSSVTAIWPSRQSSARIARPVYAFSSGVDGRVRIADANRKVVCELARGCEAMAEEMVSVLNSRWRLFR